MDFTRIAILALIIVVVVIPAALYMRENFSPAVIHTRADYCSANGFREVFGCSDGSFKAIRERFSEGFRQVYPDGKYYDCPFTLPQYQEGECMDFVVPGLCSDDDLCLNDDSCLSGADCPIGQECVDWECS